MPVIKTTGEAGTYELTELGEEYGMWLHIHDLEVCIQTTNEGVVVNIWSRYCDKEDSHNGPIASTYALFEEALDANSE